MTELDYFTIRKLPPGAALDGHVHDVLSAREPVWPYSTHPNARGRLWEWLKAHQVHVWLPGKDGYPGDDCAIQLLAFRRQSFTATSENHALCLAVLLAHYLIHHGRHFPVSGFNGRASNF